MVSSQPSLFFTSFKEHIMAQEEGVATEDMEEEDKKRREENEEEQEVDVS